MFLEYLDIDWWAYVFSRLTVSRLREFEYALEVLVADCGLLEPIAAEQGL